MWTTKPTIAEGPRDAICHLKSCQLLHSCTKTQMKRYTVGEWPWRSLKVIGITAIRLVIHHFLLVGLVCSNNDSPILTYPTCSWRVTRSIEWRYLQWPWVILTNPEHPIFHILCRLSYLRSARGDRLQIR